MNEEAILRNRHKSESVERLHTLARRADFEARWSERALRARAEAMPTEESRSRALSFDRLMRLMGRSSSELAREWSADANDETRRLDFDNWCAARISALQQPGDYVTVAAAAVGEGPTATPATPVASEAEDADALDDETQALLDELVCGDSKQAGLVGSTAGNKGDQIAPSPKATKAPVAGLPVVTLSHVVTLQDTAPATTVDDPSLDVDDPVGALTRLSHRLLTHRDYRRERAEYFRLNLQLNRAGSLAPAFRPEVTIKVAPRDKAHMLKHRDQLVIDYHWCQAKKMDFASADAEHAALLDWGVNFDFCVAWTLSGKKWRGRYRASEALKLTTLQQCQTLKLHGPELADRLKALTDSYRESNGRLAGRRATAIRKIGEWTEQRPRMTTERHVYEKLWLAREMLGPENHRLVPELLALMLGAEVLDRRTIKGKLETLDKHVKL